MTRNEKQSRVDDLDAAIAASTEWGAAVGAMYEERRGLLRTLAAPDPVNHPPHYRSASGLEAIEVIEAFGLGFHLGNVIKYILRHDKKAAAIKDLRKAAWYLSREIGRLESGGPSPDAVPADFDLCYLASPYTKYHLGIEHAFEDAAALAGVLLTKGVKVYSPIAHTHPLAIHADLDPLDHSIWLPFDASMMRAADALIVAQLPGWKESRGVIHEIEFFKHERKAIFYLDVNELRFGAEPFADAA